jgi:molecular chaperone HtpG
VCNTVKAVWMEDKSAVSEEQYKAFYQFIAQAYDEPLYRYY